MASSKKIAFSVSALLAAAALNGLVAGTAVADAGDSTALKNQVAGHASGIALGDKEGCSGKDECKGKDGCDGKDGCEGKDGCSSKDECKGKDSCSGKKEGH